jgi:hypothetical protein
MDRRKLILEKIKFRNSRLFPFKNTLLPLYLHHPMQYNKTNNQGALP